MFRTQSRDGAVSAPPGCSVRTVLAVIPSNTFGGAHNQVLQLSAGLQERGYRTSVLVPAEPGTAADRLSAAGISVRAAALRRPRAGAPLTWLSYLMHLPRQVRTLRAAIRGGGADIVQAHGLLQLDVAVAARLEGRPLVWQLLDTRPPRWLILPVAPVMLALATAVMTTGSTTAEAYPPLLRSRKPVVPFYPPLGFTTAAAPAPPPADDQAGVVFGCLANINPQKRFDVLVRAFRAADVGDHAILRLRGAVAPGHEGVHDALTQLIGPSTADIDLRAEYTSSAEFLPQLDVFVLGSARRSEGTPTVILEAMALGLPVVATRVGGVPELVDDGVTGFLVEPGDVEAMARRIRQLAVDAEMRRSMGLHGRERAQHLFSLDRTLQAYGRTYEACLVGRGA